MDDKPSSSYDDFLFRRTQLDSDYGFEPVFLPDYLFAFQEAMTSWAVRKGRGAIFSDCGTGKAIMALVWAENVRRHTGRPVLVVAPLAVTFQLEAEAAKFGIDAATSRTGAVAAGITITNYDRLHLFTADDYAGIVADESSAIKSFDGVRRALVTEFMRRLPYRLLCTATAAPNDYLELGTSSEALGYLGYLDMLSRFFVNDGKTPFGSAKRGPEWRFKGHAEDPFWRWVSSWARAMRKPSDLGFSDEGFDLPPLSHREHVIQARAPRPDLLFDLPAVGLREEREEQRRTITERCEMAASVLSDADAAVAWCQLNNESSLLARLIDGAVEVRGGDDPDAKEEALLAFSRGQIRVLVTKPSIGAWGLNWQHCHRMAFFPNHSYEQYYQAVRRCWRYGQTQPVIVDVVTTEGSAGMLRNLQRKAERADRMFSAMVKTMGNALHVPRQGSPDVPINLPEWLVDDGLIRRSAS